jgi:hypothetical protein
MGISAVSSSAIDPRYSTERPSSGQQNAQIAVIKTQAAQEKAVADIVEQAAETVRSSDEVKQSTSRPGVGERVDIRA